MDTAPARPGRGDRGVLRAARHRADAGRCHLVASAPGPAGLDHARRAGGRVRLAGRPAPRADHGHRHPVRVHPRGVAADLAGRRADPGEHRERVGASLDGAGRVRPVLRAQPAGRVRGRGRPHHHRRAAVAAVGHGHRDRGVPHRGRPAARAVLHRPAAAGAGADRAGRAGRAGAAPAGRAGPHRGTGPAGRGDARRGHPPGEPDGAAGGRAADDRAGRGDPAGRGEPAGGRRPGPGRAARPGRHPAHRAGG